MLIFNFFKVGKETSISQKSLVTSKTSQECKEFSQFKNKINSANELGNGKILIWSSQTTIFYRSMHGSLLKIYIDSTTVILVFQNTKITTNSNEYIVNLN